MTIQDILVRKKEVLDQRRLEQQRIDDGIGDEFELGLLDEELHDLNAQLRSLRGAPRSIGTTNSGLSMDRQQYKDWLAAENDDDWHNEHQKYIDALKNSVAVLTPRQNEVFELWQNGMNGQDLADRLRLDRSTVSRTLARAKSRLKAEANRISLTNRLDGMTVFDMADRDVAKTILACLTPHQTVCMYLYYGEWLSLRDCGDLLGSDHTAVLRTVQRALWNIQDTLRCGTFTIDNVDALGDMAYELFMQSGPPDETTMKHEPAKSDVWARKALGYDIPNRGRARRHVNDHRTNMSLLDYRIKTSDGMVDTGGKPHRSLIRPMGKLLSLLYTLREKYNIGKWLMSLFRPFNKKKLDPVK